MDASKSRWLPRRGGEQSFDAEEMSLSSTRVHPEESRVGGLINHFEVTVPVDQQLGNNAHKKKSNNNSNHHSFLTQDALKHFKEESKKKNNNADDVVWWRERGLHAAAGRDEESVVIHPQDDDSHAAWLIAAKNQQDDDDDDDDNSVLPPGKVNKDAFEPPLHLSPIKDAKTPPSKQQQQQQQQKDDHKTKETPSTSSILSLSVLQKDDHLLETSAWHSEDDTMDSFLKQEMQALSRELPDVSFCDNDDKPEDVPMDVPTMPNNGDDDDDDDDNVVCLPLNVATEMVVRELYAAMEGSSVSEMIDTHAKELAKLESDEEMKRASREMARSILLGQTKTTTTTTTTPPVFDRYTRATKLLTKTENMEIYEGTTDNNNNKRVIIKVFLGKPNKEWHDELQALLALPRHTNVAEVLDFYRPPRAALVMKHPHGMTLRQHLDKHGVFAHHHASSILQGIANGLQHLHQHGMVHHNLCSDNIMMDDDDVPVLVDVVKTSVRWMAPETLLDGVVTPSSNVYSLAIVTYEVLTGARPFASLEQDVRVAAAVAYGTRPPAMPRIFARYWHARANKRPSLAHYLQWTKTRQEKQQEQHKWYLFILALAIVVPMMLRTSSS